VLYSLIQNVLEKIAIVLHRKPQIFGICLPVPISHGNFMGGSIILHHSRVFHGNVRCLLLEVAHGVATSLQSFMHEPIGLCDCPPGIIDEISLRGCPVGGEAIAFPVAQGPDVKLLHAFLAGTEDRFRAPRASLFIDQAIIFRAEFRLELLGLIALIIHHYRDGDGRYRDDEKD